MKVSNSAFGTNDTNQSFQKDIQLPAEAFLGIGKIHKKDKIREHQYKYFT